MEDPELERRRAEEYQMQLFGLHSRTVNAAINQKIIENVDSRCKKIYSSIQKKYNPDTTAMETLKSNIRNLRKAYQHNMQPHLLTIENVINKFISIPNNVLLEADKCQGVQYSDEEFQNLERKLEYLQQQAKRVTMFNAALKEESEIIDRIQESKVLARRLCGIIDRGFNAKKLSNKTLHAVAKCKELTDSLNSLKPPTLKDIYNPKLEESELEPISLD